ncbi:MAG: hypothetical protein IPP90_23055 [Gemmatimonadaceae bacterium]|nr:hypothetical protein [Gemmatimonadaceae bacterium]
MLIPLGIVAPAAAATSGTPVPVLIALHGAGGDENMFIDAQWTGRHCDPGPGRATPSGIAYHVRSAYHRQFRQPDGGEAIGVSREQARGTCWGTRLEPGLPPDWQQRPQQITAVACLAGGSAVGRSNAPPIMFISRA